LNPFCTLLAREVKGIALVCNDLMTSGRTSYKLAPRTVKCGMLTCFFCRVTYGYQKPAEGARERLPSITVIFVWERNIDRIKLLKIALKPLRETKGLLAGIPFALQDGLAY